MQALYLAIDQGGHASRVLAFDAMGRQHAVAYREIATRQPAADRVEHDPEALVTSIRQALEQVVDELDSRADALRAAGLATQRSSIVCWDRRSGEALSPVISWADRRAAQLIEQLDPDQRRHIRRLTGLFPNPHYGASKLRWCLEHLPEVASAAANGRLAMGPLSSFLLFRLLRERPLLVDPANGSRTLLMARTEQTWSPELLDIFGLQAAWLPRPVHSRFTFGHIITPRGELPLQICTGDQSAALFADGLPTPGSIQINAGSGAFVQTPAPADGADCDPRLLHSTVYRDDTLHLEILEGTVNGAGTALRWWQRQYPRQHFEQHLEHWLADIHTPPLFLNGIGGVGSPFWWTDLVSRFVGEGGPEARAVAVVESIVFLIQANLDAMQACVPLERIVLSGGLAASTGLCRRLASCSGLEVWRSRQTEATARGLAWLLAGRPDHWPGEPRHLVAPEPASQAALRQRYQHWLSLMQEN